MIDIFERKKSGEWTPQSWDRISNLIELGRGGVSHN